MNTSRTGLPPCRNRSPSPPWGEGRRERSERGVRGCESSGVAPSPGAEAPPSPHWGEGQRLPLCPASGFTLIELLISIGLMTILLLGVWQTVRFLMFSSARTMREATELALAVRMGSRFREDLRQASQVSVGKEGDRVELLLPQTKVQYQRGSDGRLERVEGDTVDKGPTLRSAHFELAPSPRLLHARWVCGDELDGPNFRPREAAIEAHVLILDTAVRAEGPERPTP